MISIPGGSCFHLNLDQPEAPEESESEEEEGMQKPGMQLVVERIAPHLTSSDAIYAHHT